MPVYLNTDLDLESNGDLRQLASALEARGMFSLHVTQQEDGSWIARFETEEQFDDPARNITAILVLVEALTEREKAAWTACTVREFNVGYEGSAKPSVLDAALSNDLLARLVAVGASLRFTLYFE